MQLKVDKTGFPDVVPEDYRNVYAKFLEAEAVQSIPEHLRSLAFVSYTQKLDRKVKYTFDYTVDPSASHKVLRLLLRRNGLIHGLQVKEYSAKLSLDKNDFLNSLLNPTFVGILRFEDGKRTTVNKALADATVSLFNGRFPRQFSTKKNIKTTLLSKTCWVCLNSNPMLELALYEEAGRTGIILRYKIAYTQMFFYGNKESSVKQIHSNIKRQLMARRLYD